MSNELRLRQTLGPNSIEVTSILDRPSARRRVERAGRDGSMGSTGAEQRDTANEKKEQEKEDAMTSDVVA